ncbi:hypothetical protein B5G28_11290 [Faecalibacterium sp. An77]|uniref:GLUG motif-containing protein n=1 Tax=Faecalibacterium sp. An77 TaxID=1965655 RepID=UPI000B3AECFB|nr:GLUG motif-containing protein [Faecalibacterium sp. An77]OUN36948.1 hypothetical protein B5G28_11290 [Faecalibacterium sp. An77]
MTCMKKLTALLVSAALALSLLAGCGGSKALSQVIADLLSGQYNNVTVEVDPDLTAALKKAAAAGDTQEEVLAALVENLNLSGGSITFSNLGDGQQGQHGVTLTFQPGSDPDAAARSAFTEWNRVFSSLPDDGSYRAHVSMIEAEGGYYIAVDVEVLKAGSHDKDEPDPDYVIQGNTYIVYTAAGLRAWAEAAKANPSTNCTLARNIDLENQPWTPVGDVNNAYTGTFDGGKHTISGLKVDSSAQVAGLFGRIGEKGTVQALTLATPDVKSTYTNTSGYAGAVVGLNEGAIENCHVTGGSISGNIAGGVVGINRRDGSVIGCSSSAKVNGTGSYTSAGGVVGYNLSTVTGCSSTGTVTGDIAGGVVGCNDTRTVTACYFTGTVNGNATGGVVGSNTNAGEVTACYATGSVTATGGSAGGVVGVNSGSNFTGTITACYWSGTVDGDKGVGDADDDDDLTGKATKVDGSTTWETAVEAMNSALEDKNSDWRYTFTGSLPTLTKN